MKYNNHGFKHPGTMMRRRSHFRFHRIFFACVLISLLIARGGISEENAGPDKEGSDAARERQNKEERERLLLGQDKMISGERKSGLQLHIDDVDLPVPAPKSSKTFPVPKFERKGPCFYADGRPAYMLGGEAGMQVYPFLYKIMGFNWVQLGGPFYPENTLRASRDKDVVHISWRHPIEAELLIEELLDNGLLVYANPTEVITGPLFAKDFPDLLVTLGHFYSFRHDHPEAWKIRENWFKSMLSATAKYPIAAYELFNEVTFMDYGPLALERFRSAMARKHGTIDQANRVWRTSFSGFERVIPPMMGGGWDATFTVLDKNVSRMLWLDWLKFSEDNSAEAFKKTADLVKRHDPAVCTTIQTHCLFMYDYGASGVNPLLKSKAEDFYGDESSMLHEFAFPDDDRVRCVPAVSLLWLDYLAQIVPDKPQVSEETMTGCNYIDLASLSHVENMNNARWKFHPDNDEKGESLGYARPDFDDSGWKNIKVPDMWANQGYADTSVGWYRYAFSIPEKFRNEKIYVNGQELADSGVVYVNGKEIHRTASYTERFGVEITPFLRDGNNVMAVRIKNTYFQAERYWGGIRKWMSLDVVAADKRIPLNYGQLRSFLWERAIHGEGGVFLSYAYSPEGQAAYSLFDPARMERSALKAMPQAKAELESVGEIVLAQKPRIKGRVALVFPLETMRYHIHPNVQTMMKGPLIADLSRWYVSLVCSGVPLSVIPNAHLLDEHLDNYQAIFMQGNDRAPGKVQDALREYVKKGGILVLDSTSLKTEDDLDRALDSTELLGCRRLTSLADEGKVDLSPLGLGMVPTEARQRDGSRGCELEATSAQILARDEKGRPAIVMNRLGKGKVITIAREFPAAMTVRLLQSLLQENQITPDVSLQVNREMMLVEKYVLGQDGRYLLYVHNWGWGNEPVTVKLLKDIAPGSYRIRDLETRQALANKISAADLKAKGVRVKLASQTPLALLVEQTRLKPWSIQGINEDQERWLNFLTRPSPEHVPRNKRMLMDGSHQNVYSRIYLLTAVKALEDQGYEVNVLRSEWTKDVIETHTDRVRNERLEDYGLLFIGGARVLQASEAARIVKWVNDGGRLFLCGNWHRGPHGWLSNYSSILSPEIYSKLGGAAENIGFEDPKECMDGWAVYPIFGNIAAAAQTRGVSKLHTQGMAVLKLTDPAWQPLVKGNPASNHPDAPAIAIRTMGKGKVVLCGDAAWLKPSMLSKGDNQKLFFNLIHWLSEE